MGSNFQHDLSNRAYEQEIVQLSDQNGASPADVRALFVSEFARLKMGARVGAYLTVLTTSNVRGILRREAARLAAAAEELLR